MASKVILYCMFGVKELATAAETLALTCAGLVPLLVPGPPSSPQVPNFGTVGENSQVTIGAGDPDYSNILNS